jgi:hypothetical protein
MTIAGYKIGLRLALAMLALGCAAGLLHIVSVIGFHVPLDPNEGWNAYFAQLAMRTGSPYPSSSGFLVNNYPPLSFFLIGQLARIDGDAIVTGRIVSLLSLGVTALGIVRVLELMDCTRPQAIFAALLFIACLMLTSDYVGMNDPQLLGHAISIWGAVVIVRAPGNSRAQVIAALLFVLAFFVKHNLLLLPLSFAAWLMLINRRSALNFVAGCVIFLLIGLGIFRSLFGTSLFHQLASERLYAFENIRIALQNWLPWSALPICGALLLFLIGRRDRHAIFAVMYAAIATVGGFVFASGAGVDANAMFDADVALVLCAGLLLNRLEYQASGVLAAFLYIAPLAILLQGSAGEWMRGDYWLQPMAQDRLAAAAEIKMLKAAPDPVLCEMLSLCYWAGKEAQVDVFNMDQRFHLRAHSDAQLVNMIEQKRFSMIELESLAPFPLAGGTQSALTRSYRIVRLDDERVLFVPR